MTRKEIIEEILSIKKVDSKANLNKKTLPELQKILKEVQSEIQEEVEEVVAPAVDMEALMAEMRAKLMAELKEEARKEVEQELAVSQPTEKKDLPLHRQVPVMNITNGGLIYVSKRSGAEWRFERYGDVENIELQELLTMRSSQRKFFDEPFILILDEEVVEFLGLKKSYEKLIKPDSIDEVFNMNNDDFKEVIEKAPRGIKQLIVSRAREKYDNGTFDSIRKIKILNETMKTDIGQRG